MIKFNIPAVTGREAAYIAKVIHDGKFSGNHDFTKHCRMFLENRFTVPSALITPSCTHSLEMAALLSEIKENDEVIMPSYCFPSAANAFVMRKAKIVFIDIRPDTMNIDENLIEPAITRQTRAILVMHYAGVACDMDKILNLSRKYNLIVIEDAAQAIYSKYKGKFCGTFGQFGCFSFHETKNIQCGEGGAIFINSPEFIERAEIIQEKGTNRAKFFKGEVDKYTWVDIGSSYLSNELSAAFLLAQLEAADEITLNRLRTWDFYYKLLTPLSEAGLIELPSIPPACNHNGHIFYIKVKDLNERSDLIAFLKKFGIHSVFHYVPLHSSLAGMKFGMFHGENKWTSKESERLLRLPLYYKIMENEVFEIVKAIQKFYRYKRFSLV